jgi:hypothetical protein
MQLVINARNARRHVQLSVSHRKCAHTSSGVSQATADRFGQDERSSQRCVLQNHATKICCTALRETLSVTLAAGLGANNEGVTTPIRCFLTLLCGVLNGLFVTFAPSYTSHSHSDFRFMLLRGMVNMVATNGAKKIPIDIIRCAVQCLCSHIQLVLLSAGGRK